MKKTTFIPIILIGLFIIINILIIEIKKDNGYDKYFELISNSLKSENINMNIDFDIKKNGKTKMTAKSIQKIRNKNKKIEKTYQKSIYKTDGSSEYSMESSFDGNKILVKRSNKEYEETKELINLMDIYYKTDWKKLISYALGDNKKQIRINNNKLELHLNNYQISTLSNLMVGSLVYALLSEENPNYKYGNMEILNPEDILSGKEFIKIKSLDLISSIEKDLIKTMNLKLIIERNDKFLKREVIEINLILECNYNREEIPLLE